MLDSLVNIFTFSKDAPLIFTRFYFWAFFAVVMAGYSVIYKKEKPRNAYLFLVSLFFYYKTSGLFFMLLIFSTIVDYFIGKNIYKSDDKFKRKLLVALSVIVNLSVLVYYKYSGFFTESVNYIFGLDITPVDLIAQWTNQFAGTHFTIDKIILPVGISFFTFQTISYSIDIYRGKLKPVDRIIDFGFYVSFFPQLVAGPIVRASEFIPQLYKKYSLTKAEFGLAIFMILNGLFKKLVIADYIAVNFVDRVFSNPTTFSGFENLMALYGYSLQVYADFSGYTDVAIGVALLMGFRLPLNFNSPYKAQHTGEFWKRWHISLSTWLKDYLYIPLGGSRGTAARTNVNLMYAIFLTFNFITATRIWFRAESMQAANSIMHQITHSFYFNQIIDVLVAYKIIFGVMLLGYVIHWLPVKTKNAYKEIFISFPQWAKVAVVTAAVLIIWQARTAGLQPFIYFQF